MIALLAFAATAALADLPDADYLNALKIAQARIQRDSGAKQLRATALGPNYQKGDSWDVIAWSIDPTEVRQIESEGDRAHATARPALLHYEVIEAGSEAVLHITQREGYGIPILDPRVQYINLRITPALKQLSKVYGIKGRAKPQVASAEGFHVGISLLELFPLEVPDLASAVKTAATTAPVLPEDLEPLARRVGWKAELSDATYYEHDDFFGRQVLALWKAGDLWPGYLKTANGVSIRIGASR